MICPPGLRLPEESFVRFAGSITRLYEQGVDELRIGDTYPEISSRSKTIISSFLNSLLFSIFFATTAKYSCRFSLFQYTYFDLSFRPSNICLVLLAVRVCHLHSTNMISFEPSFNATTSISYVFTPFCFPGILPHCLPILSKAKGNLPAMFRSIMYCFTISSKI